MILQCVVVWLTAYANDCGLACWHPRGGAEYRLSPSHKVRLGTNCETSSVPTGKLTITRHKNRSCKYMEKMYCDSDYNNVILCAVINTLYTCLAGVKDKMTVGVSLCTTQRRDMYTVFTSTRLSCEEATRCMSMIWFRYNTSKSGDEQISVKETYGPCEGRAEQQCFQLSGWLRTVLLSVVVA